MKKIITMVAAGLGVVAMAASLCSCGMMAEYKEIYDSAESIISEAAEEVKEGMAEYKEESANSEAMAENIEKARECLEGIMNEGDTESIKEFLTDDSLDKAQELFEHYSGAEFEVTVEKAGDFEGYELYKYTAKVKNGEGEESGIVVLLAGDDGYKLCMDPKVHQNINENILCASCSGTGSVLSGGNACGICGGTGQQYIPNAYFDAALGMWQGQYQACSGCGGAGMTGASYVPCASCGGCGLIF